LHDVVRARPVSGGVVPQRLDERVGILREWTVSGHRRLQFSERDVHDIKVRRGR
jgi:hypothetical protein